MGLDKQTLSAPFVQGPDQKTNPKLQVKLAKLINAVFRGGTIQKRAGRETLSAIVSGGYDVGEMMPSIITSNGYETLDSGEALTAYGDELFRINDGVAYGLAETTDQWVSKAGGNNYCTTTLVPRIIMPSGTGAFDQAIVGNIGVIAWTNNGMHVAVYDVPTGVFFQTGVTAVASSTTTSRSPRLVVLGTKVVALWADFTNADLYSAVIDTAFPTIVPTQTQIETDVYTSSVTFDAIAYNSALAVLVYATSGTALNLIGIDQAGAVTASPAPTAIAGAAGANGLQAGMLIQRDTSGNIYLVIGDKNASNLSTVYFIRDSAFAAITNGNIVTNTNWSAGAADFLTGASIELTTDRITLVLAEASSDGNVTTFLGTAVLGPAGVTTAFSVLPATAGLNITSDLVAYDGTAVFGCVNADGPPSTAIDGIQSSGWVVTVGGLVVAKTLIYQTQAFPLSSSRIRVARSFADGQTAKMLFFQQGRLAYSSDTESQTNDKIVEVTPLGIAEVHVTKSSAGTLPLLRVGETLYIGGGYPRVYDGRNLGETGFQLYPDVVSVADAGGGGNLSAGTYQWRFLYSWTLANGELIRGPVSPPQTLTLLASHSATLNLTTMPLAMRDVLIGGGNSLIEVYRTEANGTVFYRQSAVLSGAQNVTSVGTAIAITDNTSDANLVFGELIYTTGGVLDWEAPPAYSSACTHNNRLVVLPSEDPYSWQPSSEWSPGEAVRFSSLTVNRVPSDKGPLTGVASMDGKLVLFAQKGAFAVIGDGPDRLGQNNYPPPQIITSVDAGPQAGTPIVETPKGLVYQNANGLNLLDRSLNVQQIGSDMQPYTIAPWTLRAASVDAASQEVRFLLDDGSDIVGAMLPTLVTSQGPVCLIYNYFYEQWSLLEDYGGQAATFYQGNYTMVRSDGVVWQEQPGTFRDDGAYYSLTVETGWLKPGGPQGVQRVWYAEILGTWGSDCTLTWDVAFDYEGTTPTEPSWTLAKELDGTGEYALQGPFQARAHIGHRNESIKFRFSESDVAGTGEGIGLADLTLEVGVKRGAFKLSTGQTARET